MVKKIPRRIFLIWETLALLVAGMLTYLTLLILAPYTWVWYTALWIEGALYIAVVFLYIPLHYVNYRFEVNDDYLIVRSGVIYDKEKYLTRDSVCFVTVYNNPFTKILGISSLLVGAAGGRVVIPLLDSKSARQVQSLLTPCDL